jgi:peptidyl-prolyl cis-trans isomerase D
MIRIVVLSFLVACSGAKGGPSMNNSMNQPEMVPVSSPVVSADILAREPVANEAQVKHILIGWKGTNGDARAEKRTKADAEAQVERILDQLKAGASVEAMMKAYSEDPGSAATGRAYKVTPDASLVIEFKQLGLRLNVGEIGVVQSDFGFHIMKRLE